MDTDSRFRLEQTQLHPSGCQQWHPAIVGGSDKYFAFCSTLSTYIYSTKGFQLKKLIDAHPKCISCLSWCPSQPSMFATGSLDGSVTVWDIENDNEEAGLVCTLNFCSYICAIDWDPSSSNSLVVSTKNSSIFLWDTRRSPKDLRDMELANARKESTPAIAIVLRWHTSDHQVIASGNTDGSIRLFDITTKSLEKIPPIEKGISICDMRWDPNSQDYMLVCNTNGAIRLIDVTSNEIIRSYDREPKIQSICWMNWAPGNFCTCTLRTGVAKIWNVSQSKPIEHVRVGHVGFRSCTAVPSTSRLICSFSDGSVSLYDMNKKQKEFITEPGHTETVFATEFSPQSPNILATSSFDSTIKIWHTGTMSLIKTLVGQDGVIYSMSWSKCGQFLASSSIKGDVFIWDTSSGEVLQKVDHHSRQPVFCVDWNHSFPQHIVSTSNDRTVCVFDDRGHIYKRFRLPGAAFGCQWCPHNAAMFVCGCMDGNAYVFNTDESGSGVFKHYLSGHVARVFHTVWNPLVPGTIATGSDDKTVRVWQIDIEAGEASGGGRAGERHPGSGEIDFEVEDGDFRKVGCLIREHKSFQGHKNNVRPVLWHSEVPYLLLSGSWDGEIRLWDARESDSCFSVGKGHLADVYGLSFHPDRPFTLASSSRDSTVRLWVITGEVKRIIYDAISKHSIDEYVTLPQENGILTGPASKHLQETLRTHKRDDHKCCKEIFSFFGGKTGIEELWAAAAYSINGRDRALEENSDVSDDVQAKKIILHKNEIVFNSLAEAQSLESIKMRRSSMGGGIGGMKKEEQIRMAAKIYAQSGDLRKFCDILFELGDCERALAIAPGVGMEYWQEMAQRYGKKLADSLNEDCFPFFVAGGRPDEAVNFYSKRKQFREAFLIASAASSGSFPEIQSSGGFIAESKDDSMDQTVSPGNTDCHKNLLRSASANMADHYLDAGESVLAATSYLASNDTKLAISTLLDNEEPLLAFGLAKVAGMEDTDDRLRGLGKGLPKMRASRKGKTLRLGVEKDYKA